MPERCDLSSLRQAYRNAGLTESDLAHDPIQQFARWFADATEAGLAEPNAMVVATVGRDGRPSSRTVLLKSFDRAGFVFYTNLTSRKATEIDGHPDVALLFPWHPIARQVRIEGSATRVGREEAAAYFATRPRGSQIGAWASHQSRRLSSYDELTTRAAELERRFAGREVPLPEFWGGYRVRPDRVEFWQGRDDRLHDRLRYRREADGWAVERLAP